MEKEQEILYPNTKDWSNDQRQQWLMENSRLIWHCVRKFTGNFSTTPTIEANDLYQVASVAILGAFNNYNPEKCYRFHTYALICVENALKMLIRSEFAEKRMSNSNVLEMDETEMDQTQFSSKNYHNNPEQIYEYHEKIDEIYHIIEKHVEDHADVIFNVMCKEITQKDATILTNLSQSTISKKIRKIRLEINQTM